MKGLSNREILNLLARPASVKAQPLMLVRVTHEDGSSTLESVDFKASQVGKFEGRAGSLKRTSKGNTTRALNGRRAYVGSVDVEVVAYQA